MADLFTWRAIGTAFLIFLIRVLSISMDTLRFMLTMRGKQTISWVLGFLVTVLYVLTFNAVLKDLSNPLYLIGYSAGFATGNVVGMHIERKLAMGFSNMTIINKKNGSEIIQALRAHDFAVTEIAGQGMDGPVVIGQLVVRRRDIPKIEKLVMNTDPDTFITVEEITPLRSGYWGREGGR